MYSLPIVFGMPALSLRYSEAHPAPNIATGHPFHLRRYLLFLTLCWYVTRKFYSIKHPCVPDICPYRQQLGIAAREFEKLLPHVAVSLDPPGAGGEDQDAGGDSEGKDIYDLFPKALQVTGNTPTDVDASIIEVEQNEVCFQW